VSAPGAGSACTDADGDYEIDVPERTRTYVVTPHLNGQKTFLPARRSVRVTPGATRRANFRLRYERAIFGDVSLGCAGQTGCKVLPVAGARVTVNAVGTVSGRRRYTTRTGEDGRYKLLVRKGRYRATAPGAALDYSPARRGLNLNRARKGRADFRGCIAKGEGKSSDAVRGGTWRSTGCGHLVTVDLDRDVIFEGITGLPRIALTWKTVTRETVRSGGRERRVAYDQPRWVLGPAPVMVDRRGLVPLMPDGTPRLPEPIVVSENKVDFAHADPDTLGSVWLAGWVGQAGSGVAEGIAPDGTRVRSLRLRRS
jgi:hypothetical protein